MVCLWLPRGPWVAAVILTLMVMSSSVALVRDPRPRFLQQVKSECHYSNGMEHVRYLQRHIYNQEEHLRFDSEVGKYQAVTELGQIQAEYWNSQKGFLEQKRAKVHTFCRFNYAIVEILTVQQRGAQSSSALNKMLSGVGGFMLGLLFLGPGLFIYFRNQKDSLDSSRQDS